MIYGDIMYQRLKLINTHAVSGTIKYLEMKFRFTTSDWDGLEKWAHFSKDDLVYDIPLTDDRIRAEDHLDLTAGLWKVYLHGNKFENGVVVKRVTTNAAVLEVYTTEKLTGEPFPAIPASETERILARLTKLEKSGPGGEVINEDAVCYTESQTLRVGDNILTDDMVTLGAGWSGSLADGFKHASGSTEPLTFAVGAADGESYLIGGNYTDYSRDRGLLLALGDSYETDPYEGTGTLCWGLTCVGADGALKLIPSSGYTGTVTNLTCRKISDDGTEEIAVEMRQISHDDHENHLTGFWNVAMGYNALGESVNSTRNIAVGRDALGALKTGGRNIGIGTYAMPRMETGENNISFGADSMFYVGQAEDCITIGKGTMYYGKRLKRNIAIGTGALTGDTNKADTESEENIAVGYMAGYKCSSKNNIFIGTNAGYSNNKYNNIFIGSNAGRTTAGYNNIAIGNSAENGVYDNNIAIGANANNAGKDKCIAIGAGATNTKHNQTVIGADSNVETVVKGNFIVRGTDGVMRQIVFNDDGTCSWTEV